MCINKTSDRQIRNVAYEKVEVLKKRRYSSKSKGKKFMIFFKSHI